MAFLFQARLSHSRILRVMRAVLVVLIACAAHAQTLEVPATIRQGSAMKVYGPAGAASARMAERTIRLFPQTDGRAFGLMPVPVLTKPGEYRVEALDAAGTVVTSAPVRVLDAHFPKQNVVIAESVAELKATPQETEDAAAFRKIVSDARHWVEPFQAPLPGCRTSAFGVQRYLNGKPTGDYHGGIDQRGAAGAPIRAVADGVVKIVRDWKLHGRTVGIDHGQGLESMYLHMSRFAVTEGAPVKKGDVIGYVGSTGRSTAPHLHWSLYANGVPVNPGDWVQVTPCAAGAAKKK
jgi:murein DD-endopeptidase MepM/ murein hydrolase activator NlpD